MIYAPDPPFDKSADSSQWLILPVRTYPKPAPGEEIFPDAVRIPMNRLSWFPGSAQTWGIRQGWPDLAFISLPMSCISEIEAKKAFYDLTLTRNSLLQASTDDEILAGLDSIEEWFDPEPHTHGKELFKLATILTIFRDFESQDVRGEWDFLNVKLYPAPATNAAFQLPTSFGGFSGGPVFRYPITKKMRFEEWSSVEPALAGIVFWE